MRYRTKTLEQRLPPALRAGEEVRLVEGGPWHRVVRVIPGCAAYLQSAATEAELVEIPEKMVRTSTGSVLRPARSFWSHARGPVTAYSVHAFVVERRAAS